MAAAKTDHPLERMVFFSDAVFAIAITLLVIDIHPPHLARHASDYEHWAALGALWPSLFGYLISFLVIGAFWMGHHRAFAIATRYDPRVLRWNMAMLMVIAFMPFITSYYSSNITARVPILVYCLAMLLAALLNRKVNYTATGPTMVSPDASAEDIAYIRRRSNSVLLAAAAAVALSLVLPEAGQAGLISIPVWRRLLTSLDKRRAAKAGA
ncbi:MAG: potassium channel family protein [Sphingomonadales bacterium]|jgi:uncharacterized membrane protein|nr:potassium channel family protein [Sphingomonadales bacterium]